MVTTWGLAVATMWWVTKWAMARGTRTIVTNAVAAVTVVLASAVTAATVIAAAATTITQRHCPQCSHCSGCCHCPPPLQHCNQTVMVWVMAMEAMVTAARHCSSCCHHPPLQHHNQMVMAWAMAMEAMATATRVAGKRWRQ
jgi:hypothetical protein